MPDPVVSPAEPTGVELIAAERQRQIEVEGWTPEHDDSHGRIAFVPPWRFWPRSWFGYLWPRRITLAHNPPIYRWLWWNFRRAAGEGDT